MLLKICIKYAYAIHMYKSYKNIQHKIVNLIVKICYVMSTILNNYFRMCVNILVKI